MKIYTKTGDKGSTSLFTGERVLKNDPFLHSLGSVDECSSAIGLSLSFLPQDSKFQEIQNQLEQIQHALFDLGAAIATPQTRASNKKIEKTRFGEEATEKLEKWIDEMELSLPPLHTFILPGGHPSAAALHLARSICRRAERHTIPIKLHADVSNEVMIFLNRLSDYLFVAARKICHLAGSKEVLWKHHQ